MVGDGVPVTPRHGPDPIFTFEGLTEKSTFSVGSSDGAKENTLDFSESNCTWAGPAALGLKVTVATFESVWTARVTSAPTETDIFASPLVILTGLTTVGKAVDSLIARTSSFVGSYLM